MKLVKLAKKLVLTDFLDSSSRHFTDAELLLAEQRWANADHLYGFSAECALKALMRVMNMPWDLARDQPALHQDRTHIDRLAVRYESYLDGSEFADRFSLADPSAFSDWSASQRYAHRSSFHESRAKSHREACVEIRKMLVDAEMEGIL